MTFGSGEALVSERTLLRALPKEPYPSAGESLVRVDQKGLVTVRQNRYSVPIGLAGLRVRASVGAREIRILHEGTEVARLATRGQAVSLPPNEWSTVLTVSVARVLR